MTKSFDDDAVLISDKDFDVAHLCTEIDSQDQVKNIKSFI